MSASGVLIIVISHNIRSAVKTKDTPDGSPRQILIGKREGQQNRLDGPNFSFTITVQESVAIMREAERLASQWEVFLCAAHILVYRTRIMLGMKGTHSKLWATKTDSDLHHQSPEPLRLRDHDFDLLRPSSVTFETDLNAALSNPLPGKIAKPQPLGSQGRPEFQLS
jgi:hypothetical protein